MKLMKFPVNKKNKFWNKSNKKEKNIHKIQLIIFILISEDNKDIFMQQNKDNILEINLLSILNDLIKMNNLNKF